MTFQELNIIEPILKALKTQEYEIPTPIQYESIPVLLEGKDILGSAQTGTGKTAAFAIPILQNLYVERLNDRSKRIIKALVLAPTRELALQIHDNFKEYGRNLNIKTTVIYGGVPQSRQVQILNSGVDILVATPGRLLDLIQQRKLTLRDVSYLVLDEADRMLDMGFVKDVKKIVAMVKRERQTMFFSATMPQAIVNLSNEMLHNPVRVMVSPEEETIDKIKQSVYFVGKKKKIDLLVDLLKQKDLKSVLVFSRTKHGANHIVRLLDQVRISATAIHGNKSQGARQKALAQFKSKQVRVLVATDIAARGIDVDELSHVINYDLPEVPETYIHRIGRTGRAGLGGVAISFCSHDQANLLRDIQKHIKMNIPVMNDSVYSIDEADITALKEIQKSNKKNKPATKSRRNKYYSRKRTKGNKVEPKNFSKYDNRNQSKKR
ncbi:DEAD/DEAH box helicase [Candidatus Izimaplasma bacterium]|nr:DEAD/DEAH box helicase [Candidatus Izimaplasma bacterium]